MQVLNTPDLVTVNISAVVPKVPLLRQGVLQQADELIITQLHHSLTCRS
jgi:hypothetical protein